MWSDPGGTQLCYKALPQYQSIVQRRKETFGEEHLISDSQRGLLEEENQPIPIGNEHELAYLYLGENYNRMFSFCDILQLDLEAVLKIMSKASCFSTLARTQAAKVKKYVMNNWMRVVVEEWTPEKTSSTFSDMKRLAESKSLHEKLNEAHGGLQADHPLRQALLNLRGYRESIKNGQHEKIEEKLERLKNVNGKEIFVRRKYRHMGSDNTTDNIEDLLKPNQVTLLQGAAGAGKSSMSVKALKR